MCATTVEVPRTGMLLQKNHLQFVQAANYCQGCFLCADFKEVSLAQVTLQYRFINSLCYKFIQYSGNMSSGIIIG